LNRQFKHYVYTLVWSLDDTLYLLLDNTVKVRERTLISLLDISPTRYY